MASSAAESFDPGDVADDPRGRNRPPDCEPDAMNRQASGLPEGASGRDAARGAHGAARRVR
jgi:hypothetical protein